MKWYLTVLLICIPQSDQWPWASSHMDAGHFHTFFVETAIYIPLSYVLFENILFKF